jgi:BirA family biotin operon repressor/biotin-[acetyl-CoA-carboxylase] ligase
MLEPIATALPDPPLLIQQLQPALPQFKQIEWFERTASTNADLLGKARNNELQLARPWLLGAHLQDEGRGRAGRTWQNRAGANLMFSCAFDAFVPLQLLPSLSPIAGIAACEALRGLLEPDQRQHLAMKWPNDLQWKGAKLAGILVETTRAGTSRLSADHYVAIMGIGINLNDARALSQSLNRQVADWAEVAACDALAAATPLHKLVSAIAQAWYEALNAVISEGFHAFPARHAAVDALAGQHVNILDEGRIINAGIACGINKLGQLLLRTPDGETSVTVGDVSVRP